MLLHTRTFSVAAAAGLALWSASAYAAGDPTGIWFDHNGKGAVEISPCASGNGLCGYVVNVKDPKNADRCGLQILGNVTPEGGGWIYSPDRGRKYSVALSRLSDDKLRVVGNAGHLFSKTFTWNRAPDDIARCGEKTAAAPAKTETPAKETAGAAPAEAAAPATPVRTEPVVLHGASSASVALLAMPRQKKEDVVPAAVTNDVAPAPAAKATPAPEAKVEPAAAAKAEEESFEPERECKYRIPYINKVIKVPCRD